MPRLITAATTAALLAIVTVAAQSTFETFDPGFEGELWEMVQTLAPPAAGGPVNGVVFTAANGDLYISDSGNGTVVVYDFNRNVVNLPNADWALGQSGDSLSPVYGWEPNQLTTATVQVGTGAEQTAILISDIAEGAHRVLAFTTDGVHLFTLGLDPSGIDTMPGFINGVAMGPGAKFVLTPDDKVQLIGSFGAAWSKEARTVGGTMAFYGTVDAPFDFLYDAGDDRFKGSPSAVLRADEQVDGVPDAVPAQEPFGLTFDTLGNLYMTDSMTERLTVYGPGPNFTRLFTFGTPDPLDDGATTIEFFQSYGIRFWPDAVGTDGRLFVADGINNRVVAYRPNLAGKTLDSIFELDGIGALDGFPYGLGIDPASGRMAIGDDFGQQVWILKTPDLAAFNVRVLDDGGAAADVVCVGTAYTVRFSLTVPAGRNPVSDVLPQLIVDGAPTSAVPEPGQPGGYPATALGPGDVMTFSYVLTAPLTAGEIVLEAGVDLSSSGTTHVLSRSINLPVSSCAGAAPVIVATANPLPQLSGWTAVRPGITPKVTLLASDPTGVLRIDYQIEGTNHTIQLDPVLNSDPLLTEQTLEVFFTQMGVTTVEFAARNSNYVKSELQTLGLNFVLVDDLTNSEGDVIAPFSIGDPAPGSGVTFSATGLPGDLTIDASTGVIGGTLSFESAGGYTVTVTESRAGDQPTSVTFNWLVNDVNRLPVSGDDSYTIDEDTVLEATALSGLLADDSDADGALVVGWSDSPADGTLVVNADGSFTYTPGVNFNGTDTFHYRSNDGVVDSNLATVTITVNAVNDRPQAADATASLDEDTTLEGTLPAAVDPDSSSLTYAKASDPAHGTVTVNADGTYTYQPAPGYNGDDSFTYLANDGAAVSDPATVTITVNAVNDLPVSADDGATLNEGGLAVIDVLANDTDADGTLDPSSVTIVTGPMYGLVAVGATGTVTYTHDGGETTSDSFTYKVRDDSEFGAAATVLITVTPVNDAPVASDAAVSAIEDEVLQGVLPAATDSDSSNITYAKATDPAHGTVTVEPDGSYTYTPAPNYNGGDLFSYTANDGSLPSAPAVVTIAVDPRLDPPVAFDGSESVDEDGVLSSTLPVGADPDGSSLLYLVVGRPSQGTVEVERFTGVFTYRPSADFAGIDSFTYEANDHTAGSAPATITITVNPVNDAPVASDSSDSVTEDTPLTGTLTATDVDSANLSYAVVTDPAHGTVEVGANGGYTYQPENDYNGGDSFTFKANDGELDSNISTVTIAVNPVGDVPVAAAGSASVDEDQILLATVPVAVDVDSTDLTYALASNPAQGTVTVALDGSYAYTPNSNFHGTDTFTYTANDGALTSIAATITITVNPVNDAPVAVGDVVAAMEDIATTYTAADLVANDGDVDGDQLTVGAVTNGTGGAVALIAGDVTFTPAAGFSGVATFTYSAFDGTQTSNTVTVTVNVAAVNDAPVAMADILAATEDTPASYPAASLLGNDTDAEGTALTIAGVTSGVGGTAVLNAGGVTFTPTPDFSGAATFTYTVTDGALTSEAATVSVDVVAVNDAPVAVADTVDATEDTAKTYAAAALLDNDSDADGNLLTIAAVTDGIGGTVTLDGGNVTFTPAADLSGAATFTYTVTDGTLTSTATVTVNVAAVNDAPVAVVDTLTATEDTAAIYPAAALLANDTDADSVGLTIASVADGAGGTVTLSAGIVTFRPVENLSGAATFSYTVTDGALTSTATVTVNVAPVNDAPVAADDTFSIGQGLTLTVAAPGVLAGDIDVDSAALTASLLAGPSHGELSLDRDGSFVYRPVADFHGSDSFTYRANDTLEFSGQAVVHITIVPSNLPPVCTAVASPSILWPPNHKPVYLTLSGITDPDGGTPTIRFTSILQDEPTNSSGQGNTMLDGGIEEGYTKAWVRPERTGDGDGRVYLISYTATDAAGARCTGEVTVSVPHDRSGAPAVLSPGRWDSLTGQLVLAPPLPVAVDDTATVTKGDDTIIAVQANDVADGSPLAVTIVSKPAKGTAKVNANGTIRYAAPSNWTGTTTFTYRISDIYGATSNATITITVTNSSHEDDDGDHGDDGDDDDDCGDDSHDHDRDRDNRDRDHRRGDHDRCNHRR